MLKQLNDGKETFKKEMNKFEDDFAKAGPRVTGISAAEASRRVSIRFILTKNEKKLTWRPGLPIRGTFPKPLDTIRNVCHRREIIWSSNYGLSNFTSKKE